MSFLLYEDKMSSACRMCRTVPGTDEVLKTASWYFAVTAWHDGKKVSWMWSQNSWVQIPVRPPEFQTYEFRKCYVNFKVCFPSLKGGNIYLTEFLRGFKRQACGSRNKLHSDRGHT